jgi:ABC-type amino acid transport substrate-binding protein
MTAAEQSRSAALLLWPRPLPPGPPSPPLRAAFPGASPPSPPRRLLQALAVKRGRLGWEGDVVTPLVAARQAALGERAAGPPRALVRVDEFPHARAYDPAGRFGTGAFRRFHSVLAEAGVPYLLAASARVARDYLDPGVSESRPLDDGELEQLRALAAEDGVTFALHGLDHRTRHRSARRRSEFCGLGVGAAAARIDAARATLEQAGVRTPVFVPPFNRFDARQYDLLAERFEVVCGGPESIRLLGFAPTPAWRGEAVYLPSYPPLYGRSREVIEGLRRLEDQRAGIWAPVTLHWGWELEDDFAGLRELCRLLARNAVDWREFLGAVELSRRRASEPAPGA